MHSSSCLYIGSLKSLSFISDLSEFLLTSIAFATVIVAGCQKRIFLCGEGMREKSKLLQCEVVPVLQIIGCESPNTLSWKQS